MMFSVPDNSLLLTSTGRLARSLQRAYRRKCIEEGRRGWERPDLISLNAWLEREWSDSWPELLPGPEMLRMGLWKSVLDILPPPAPLEPAAALCRMLDDTFGTLVGHRIDPTSGHPSTALVAWRRQACGLFRSRLSEAGYFHPQELPLRVARGLEGGTVSPPPDFTALGFEFPSPAEEELFRVLAGMSRRLPDLQADSPPGTIEAVALPTPEQEIMYLCRRLAEDALTTPLHRIGVVAPDLESVRTLLLSCMEDVFGTPPKAGEAWFNITLGRPLSSHPLTRAALLPLLFFLEGEKRETFLALVLSTYFGFWRGRRSICARADRTWRTSGVEGNLEDMRRALERAPGDLGSELAKDDSWNIMTGLRRRLGRGRKPLREWTDHLADAWKALGFPVMADEEDQLAWRHLNEIVTEMRTHMGEASLGLGEFVEWLTHRAFTEKTQAERPEDAGIQIMGIIEARGLDFDRLYLTGMNDGSLPRPARPLPLMDTWERSRVQGGTTKSQLDFAETAFNRLVRSAPAVTLLRAEQEDTAPFTPSPFWPEVSETAGCDIWLDPDPAWMRASWLRSAWTGLLPGSFPAGDAELASEAPLAEELFREKLNRGLPPSRLKTALACPFMFLVRHLLNIEPLDEISPPPTPLERGRRIHRILALFTKKVRSRTTESLDDRNEAWLLLKECAESVLSRDLGDLNWRLELERLLGSPDSTYPGLLQTWLDREHEHRRDGWNPVGEEIAFSGLLLPGWPFSMRGIIDRIDYNPREGWACLDYKTGSLPSDPDVSGHFIDPQLAVYVMALREGKVEPLAPGPDDNLGAGYIQLKGLNEIRYRFIAGLPPALDQWRGVIATLGENMVRGSYEPYPFPLSHKPDRERACHDCPFRTLCIQGLKDEPDHGSSDAEGTEESSHEG